MEQFRQPGKQVVIYPDEYKTGDVIAPFEKAREAKAKLGGRRRRGIPRRFSEERVIFSLDLLFEAVLFGVLLGLLLCRGEHRAVGLLRPARRAARRAPGGDDARLLLHLRAGRHCGLDPILAGVLLMPAVLPARHRSSTASTTRPSRSAAPRRACAGSPSSSALALHHRGRADPRLRRRPAHGRRRPTSARASTSAGRHPLPYRMLVRVRRRAGHDRARSRSTWPRPSPAAPSRPWRRTSRRCA